MPLYQFNAPDESQKADIIWSGVRCLRVKLKQALFNIAAYPIIVILFNEGGRHFTMSFIGGIA
jgi:hypothetical protein